SDRLSASKAGSRFCYHKRGLLAFGGIVEPAQRGDAMYRLMHLGLFSLMLVVVGCGTSERGVGEWQRVGECEVQVESVRLGKVQGKGTFGPAESSDEVFTIRTLFRNQDKSCEVKHSPWQSDSSLLVSGITLTDDKGTRFQTLHFGMFGGVEGRQQKDAELK